jgi:TRAP-type mannitol/chloroaromatic compound transport system permease small subunit
MPFDSNPPADTGGPAWLYHSAALFDRITQALNVLGTLLIVAIMLLVNADVIGRSLFDKPISGVPEMVSMSIVAIVFLQIAHTFRQGRLTRTDALPSLVQRKSPRARALMEIVFSLGAAAIVLQLLLASWPLFIKSWVRKTYEGTIGDFTAPVWPVKLIILIGCAALIVQLIIHLLRAGYSLYSGKPLPHTAQHDEL